MRKFQRSLTHCCNPLRIHPLLRIDIRQNLLKSTQKLRPSLQNDERRFQSPTQTILFKVLWEQKEEKAKAQKTENVCWFHLIDLQEGIIIQETRLEMRWILAKSFIHLCEDHNQSENPKDTLFTPLKPNEYLLEMITWSSSSSD